MNEFMYAYIMVFRSALFVIILAKSLSKTFARLVCFAFAHQRAVFSKRQMYK